MSGTRSAVKRKPATKKASRKPGRRSSYPDGYVADMDELVYQLCLLGATDQEMSDAMGISRSTLNAWRNEYPSFLQSILRGKRAADARVASALFSRAIGYEHDDVDIKVIANKIVKTPLRKHYPPEVAACIFWLKNRAKETWRDKIEYGNTDKEGKDVPAMDPVEGARRMAFILAQAQAELAKEDATNGRPAATH